jgi:Spy/CpxP family protein refolding chaperone
MEFVMKRIMVGMGLTLALAGAAAAQSPGQGHEGHAKQEQGARGARGERRGRGGPDGLLLKDITLTEGQRAQIAKLRKTERDAMEAKRAQGKKEFEAMRDARQRGDTAAVRAQMAKLRQAREQERAQRIAAIRNVLTADQRVQFDRNVAELKQREAERVAKFGERGQRGQKTGRPGRGFGRGR